MSVTETVALGVLLPVAISTLGCLLAWWAERRKQPLLGTLSMGVGLVGGLTGAQWVVSGWPPFPPVDVTQGLPYLGVLALPAALLQESKVRWSGWARSGAVVLCLGFLLRPKIIYSFTPLETGIWGLSLVCSTLLLWQQLSRPRGPGETRLLYLLLLVPATGASLALILGHSALLAQLGGAVAAGVGALLGISLVLGSVRMNAGGAGTVTVFSSSLLVCGHFYASLPAGSALLLAAGFLLAGARLSGTEVDSGWKGWVIRGGLVTVLTAWAVFRAYSLNPGIEDYYEY